MVAQIFNLLHLKTPMQLNFNVKQGGVNFSSLAQHKSRDQMVRSFNSGLEKVTWIKNLTTVVKEGHLSQVPWKEGKTQIGTAPTGMAFWTDLICNVFEFLQHQSWRIPCQVDAHIVDVKYIELGRYLEVQSWQRHRMIVSQEEGMGTQVLDLKLKE